LQSLFLKDAGFEFKDIRYAYDETWPETSKKLKEDGLTRTGLLPAIEYKGEKLTQVSTLNSYLFLLPVRVFG
jgi:glutathione S-transferase